MEEKKKKFDFKKHKKAIAAAIVAIIVMLAGGGYYYHTHQTKPGLTKAQLDSIHKADSMALHVAIVANDDCMPIFYAKECGMADSLGLDLRILGFNSLMDADTALMNKHAEICYTDIPRAILMQKDSFDVNIIASLPDKQVLLTNKGQRINNIRQIKERMVALSRHSESDFLSDVLTDSAKIQHDGIYRPQINNLLLRYKMLCLGQYDAAFLPQPYADMANKQGHKTLWEQTDTVTRWGALVMSAESQKHADRLKQAQLLCKIYDIASQELSNRPKGDVVAKILKEYYGMSEAEIKLAPKHRFTRLSKPSAAALEAARAWLVSREQITKKHDVSKLNTDKILK